MSCAKRTTTCEKNGLICPTTGKCPAMQPLVVADCYERPAKYEDSECSDRGCSDFSSLCEDKPRKCVLPKQNKERNWKILTEIKNGAESDFSGEEDEENIVTKERVVSCRGCANRCQNCAACAECGCRECSDYSKSSVVRDLGNSESDSCCPNLSKLACDHKKECLPICPATARGKTMKFTITFGKKGTHQWADYMTKDEAMYVNGKIGPVLHLYRGETYYFTVEQENKKAEHMFVLTMKPGAGSGSRPVEGSFTPIAQGTICYKPDQRTPRIMFYGCSKDAYVGGMIMVHD